jgi:hypothetical protein
MRKDRAAIKEYSLAKKQSKDELDSLKDQQALELRNYETAQRNSTSLGSPKDKDVIKEQVKALKEEQKRAYQTLKTSLDVRDVQAKQKQLDAQYEAFVQRGEQAGYKPKAFASRKKRYETLSNRNAAKIAILEGMDRVEAYETYGLNYAATAERKRAEARAVEKQQRLDAAKLRQEQKPELKAAEEKARRLAATAGMTEEQKAQRMTDINNEKIKSGLMGQSGVALSSQAQRDEQNFMDSQPMLTNYADRSRAFGAYQRTGLTFDDSYEQAFGNAYASPSGSGVLYASKGGSMTKPLDFRKGGFVPVKDKKK